MDEHNLDTLSEYFKAYHELWLVNVKLKEAVKIFEVYLFIYLFCLGEISITLFFFFFLNFILSFHMLTVNLEITTQRKRLLKSIWSSENTLLTHYKLLKSLSFEKKNVFFCVIHLKLLKFFILGKRCLLNVFWNKYF